MASELHVTTTVLPGCRVEIVSPELAEGVTVDVTIQIPDGEPRKRLTMQEILATLPPGPRLFATPDDADRFLKEERDSWDR